MFIENGTTYHDAIDYAEQNDKLVWSGKEDFLTALNDWYFVRTLIGGKIFVQAGNITWYAPSVEEGKAACNEDFKQTYGEF